MNEACGCGCGAETKKGNRFIHGHHTKGAISPGWKGGVTLCVEEGQKVWKNKCMCGCGLKVRPGKKFIHGHSNKGSNSPTWKGGKAFGGNNANYEMNKIHGHHRARPDGYVYKHILMAEAAMGKPLPPGAEMHHFKGYANKPGNLVVCQDRAYHVLLHQRQRAYDACGHANWRKCTFCKEYDNVENLSIYNNNNVSHPVCRRAYVRKRSRSDGRPSSLG